MIAPDMPPLSFAECSVFHFVLLLVVIYYVTKLTEPRNLATFILGNRRGCLGNALKVSPPCPTTSKRGTVVVSIFRLETEVEARVMLKFHQPAFAVALARNEHERSEK